MSSRRKVAQICLGPVLTVAGILVALLFVTGCGALMKVVSGPASQNAPSATQGNSNETNSSTPSFDSAAYRELLGKKEELAKASKPVKLDPNAVIKGKVFVATNNLAKSSDYSHLERGIADYRMAKGLDEIGTLIQVNCLKGRYVATYVGKYDKKVKGFAVDCKVSLVDQAAGVTIAQKTFSNAKPPEVITSIEADVNDEYLMPRPLGDIAKYIDSFAVDKEIASPNILSEKELLRLPTKPATGMTAAIKGKAMVAQKSDEGDITPFASNTNYSGLGLSYGLPYDRLSGQPGEVETVIKVVCGKGDQIGRTGNTTQFSNRCVVSLIDYKSSSLIAEKTFENRTVNPDARQEDFPLQWIVQAPASDIESYIRSLPLV